MTPNDILSSSPYANIWDRINKVKKRTKDTYQGKSYFPIGTIKPIQAYPLDEDIPKEDLFFYKLDTTATDDATSNCLVGQSGTLKTTLIKTMAYYNSFLSNTRGGVLDLKGNSLDWAKCNYPHQNQGMLFRDEPATLGVEAGVPLFATRNMPERDKHRVRLMNLPIHDFADMKVLKGLGFSHIAMEHLYKLINQKKSIKEIIDEFSKLYSNKKIRSDTKQNFDIVFGNMVQNGFLSDKNNFSINDIWDRGLWWTLGMSNKEIPYLSVYVDKMLTQIFDRAQSSKGKRERYWIVVDDCQKAFGQNPDLFPSVQTGIDALTQWRSVGINMNIGVQSITMLNKEIYSDIKHFFIYKCGNPSEIMSYIPNKSIVEAVKRLKFYPEKHISQCVHVYPDKQRFDVFYPFNAQIAN